MAESSMKTTMNSAAQVDQAAMAELRALNPEQQQIVRDVMAAHPSLSLSEALAHLKEAGL